MAILAAQPPMPSDPTICRWCAVRRIPVGDAWICPAGCAPNHLALRHERCTDCETEFETGNPWEVICWPCADRETRQGRAAYVEPGQKGTGYMHDMRKAGANARAVDALRKDVS